MTQQDIRLKKNLSRQKDEEHMTSLVRRCDRSCSHKGREQTAAAGIWREVGTRRQVVTGTH